MTIAEALTAIRATTNHGTADADDSQTTNAMMTAKLDRELQLLRRQLNQLVPSLYESVTTPAIAAGATTIAKPTNTERIRRLERLISGTDYFTLEVVDPLSANYPNALSFYEQGSNYVVRPDADAPGNYRLTVILGLATIVGAATSTALDVPAGCDDILVERTAAWVRQRHDEDPTYHLNEAARVWKEQRSLLLRRYGAHPVPGLSRVRHW